MANMDVLPRLSGLPPDLAAALERHLQAIERALHVASGPPIETMLWAGGASQRDTSPAPFWVKISATHSGAAYSWTQQLPATGGTWTDGTTGGSTAGAPDYDPAWEQNANSEVPPDKIVVVVRDAATAELRFQYAECPPP
jgi:hypothetical protein